MTLEDFNYSLTYSVKPFEQLHTPKYDRLFLGSLEFPLHIKFNQTYYKKQNDKLQAFRLVAMSIENDFNTNYITYLIQTPNKPLQWVREFITTQSVIFSNKEDMFEYIKGNVYVNVNYNKNSNWKMARWFISNKMVKEQGYDVLTDDGGINNDWYWHPTLQKPNKSRTYIQYLLITKDNVQIGLRPCNGYFTSKESCIKHHLNDFEIDDFETDPFNIEIEVLPNTPKKYVLKFEQEEVF